MGRDPRNSPAAAQRKRMLEAIETAPFWMLDVPNKCQAKPECVALDGQVMRWNDPYWDTGFPPCDRAGCMCRVIALGERQLKRLGIAPPPAAD